MIYTQPVKTNDIIEVTIINIGTKGDGIAKHKRFTIIVPEAQIEEKCEVKIIKVFDNFAIGQKETKDKEE